MREKVNLLEALDALGQSISVDPGNEAVTSEPAPSVIDLHPPACRWHHLILIHAIYQFLFQITISDVI